MKFKKALALLAAMLLALPPLQAAATSFATSQISIESSVTYTAGKKKKKKAKAKAKTKSKATKVAAFKSCGTFMYRKDGKCLDARAKK